MNRNLTSEDRNELASVVQESLDAILYKGGEMKTDDELDQFELNRVNKLLAVLPKLMNY